MTKTLFFGLKLETDFVIQETPSLYYSTLQTAASDSGRKQVKALYDFEAAEDNELTFKTGDIITLIEQSDPNWWEGELNGKTGS